MYYQNTVDKVIAFLKEKGVCRSSQKSHKDCYKSLGDFMAERNETYSISVRDSWLESIRAELPRQRCSVWEQYVLQLEEMDQTGSISDRRLYLNHSDYSKLSPNWKSRLDSYLDHSQAGYTERTLELARIYCSRALLFLMDNDINDVDEITYEVVFMLMDMKLSCSEETKSLIINNTSRMFLYWFELGWCSENYYILMDRHLYPHVGRVGTFSDESRSTIEISAGPSLDFPAKEFRDSIPTFIEVLEKHGYVGTTLKLAKHALTALYLFLDIHSLGYHPDIMWTWFFEIRKDMGTSWLHWRRILRSYDDYTQYGDIDPDKKYQYDPSALSGLPAWCRQIVEDFLDQKRRESREPGTVRTYLYSCIRFCNYLSENGYDNFAVLTPEIVNAFARQDKHSSFKGKATSFVLIRGFLTYLCENGYTDYPKLDRCLLAGTAPEEKIIDVLSSEQIDRINEFRKEHDEPIELRDIAIVLLGLRMGLRASDVLNLHFDDIDWVNCTISIVMQKTKTQITLPMPVDVGNAIYAYIVRGRPKNGGSYIFIRSKAPYGKLTGKVCTKALYRILPERKTVTGGGFHVTRRTFATTLLRNRAGIDDVMDALGHRDPTSVMKYLLLDDDRCRSCALSLEDLDLSIEGGLS